MPFEKLHNPQPETPKTKSKLEPNFNLDSTSEGKKRNPNSLKYLPLDSFKAIVRSAPEKREKEVYWPVEGPQAFFCSDKKIRDIKKGPVTLKVKGQGKQPYKSGQVVDLVSDSLGTVRAKILKIEQNTDAGGFILTLEKNTEVQADPVEVAKKD